MQAPTIARLPQLSKSGRDDHCGTCKILIEARCTVKTTSEVVCVVRDSSMTAVASPKPQDDGWKTLEVLRRKAAMAAVTAETILRME